MRVVQVTAFGGPEVLVPKEMRDPTAGAGQVLVEVEAADTLFLETQLRGGWGREWFDAEPPYVPGNGVTGVATAVGADVPARWIGRRVAAHTGGRGGYASHALASAADLVEVPAGLDLRQASALLHDGVTALGLVEAIPIGADDRVLVTAAAGGLGLLLVQLAHAAGATVVGAARGSRKLGLVRELGADTVDYSLDGWGEQALRSLGREGPSVVFDGAGGVIGRDAFEITAPGGRFSAHGAASGAFTAAADPAETDMRQVTVTGIEKAQHSPMEMTRLTTAALAAAAHGRIKPVIGRTFPLERAADAHAAIEAREVLGKTLLIP